ncbi:EcsC family protein [Bacillus horti]|uniref:Uncharacterized protein (DUF697 family) n=1 Tax=Caldalkalibacillus horti TaxID=77523 RepID=A0ABT9W4X3_9BACI|nr:EcsC family protein [Bacillus horti]MDQ0168122.1 uncharacterized protein (DUF697 family) [Bacillus horti]
MKNQIVEFIGQGNMSKRLEELDKKFSEWMDLLPSEYQKIAVEAIDQVMFALANFCQQKAAVIETEHKIMVEARLFHEQIEAIEDMQKLSIQQLEFMESKIRSRFSKYALAEGGIAGLGHPLGLLLDFPALLTINLKMVQSIASTYGYSLRYPPEQALALKVLHAASLPKMYEEEAWSWLIAELYDQLDEDFPFYQEDQGTIIQREWLQTLAKQWIKSIGLYGLKKATKQKYSIVGAVLAAGANYQFTTHIGQVASRFYQYRFQASKEEAQTGPIK